jgi:hypothetical protein
LNSLSFIKVFLAGFAAYLVTNLMPLKRMGSRDFFAWKSNPEAIDIRSFRRETFGSVTGWCWE